MKKNPDVKIRKNKKGWITGRVRLRRVRDSVIVRFFPKTVVVCPRKLSPDQRHEAIGLVVNAYAKKLRGHSPSI